MRDFPYQPQSAWLTTAECVPDAQTRQGRPHAPAQLVSPLSNTAEQSLQKTEAFYQHQVPTTTINTRVLVVSGASSLSFSSCSTSPYRPARRRNTAANAEWQSLGHIGHNENNTNAHPPHTSQMHTARTIGVPPV